MKNLVNYANRNSYNVYITYRALEKHFTEKKYDFFKYHGKVNTPYDKFQTRKDVFYFAKLSKEHDWKNILLSNILDNPKKWIGEIADEEGKRVYLEWKSKVDSITYNVEKELSKLKDDFQDNFVSNNGDHPHLLSLFLQKEISFETFTVLSHITKVFAYWDEKVLDKIVACDIFVKSKKYHGFLEYDEKKIRKLIEKRFF